jgi:RimJ/RimL family protein N-acetyltransferase
MDPVTLRDDDLLLRPWLPGDVAAVLEACQDPEIQRWTLVPSPYTEQDAREFVAGSDERWVGGTPSFAAVDAATGELLGSIGVSGQSDLGDAEIGYWVAPTARGRGVATRATVRLCRWLFQEQAAVRITWHAVVGNVASRKVAEAAGFVVEGTARQAMVHRGRRVDAWVAAMLPADLARVLAGAPRQRTLVEGWPEAPVTLQTPRLRLRAYRASDAPALLEYSRDPVVAAWDPEGLVDLADAEARVLSWGDWSSGRKASWAVADPVDDTLLGGVHLHSVDAEDGCGAVGYGLAAAARGQGLATEAVDAVAVWVFDTLAVTRLVAEHAVANAASCGVAERAGFQLEGRLRLAHRYGDGQLHDDHLHARLASDRRPRQVPVSEDTR